MEPMVQLSADAADQVVVDVLEYYLNGLKDDTRALKRKVKSLPPHKLEDLQYNLKMIDAMQHTLSYFKVQK